MPKIVKMIVFGVLFLGLVAAATWATSLLRDKEDVIAGRYGKCDGLRRSIEKQIIAANYCRRDEECRAIASRCPWGGTAGCRYILVNRNHSISLLQTDMVSFAYCFGQAESPYHGQYGFCGEENKPDAQNTCPDLQQMKLKCVDYACVEAE